MPIHNRVTDLLGIDIPISQAPMGYVAKPPLVAAVSEAWRSCVIRRSWT